VSRAGSQDGQQKRHAGRSLDLISGSAFDVGALPLTASARTLSLDEIQYTYHYLEANDLLGKVVVSI
jgi:hypothetical protein